MNENIDDSVVVDYDKTTKSWSNVLVISLTFLVCIIVFGIGAYFYTSSLISTHAEILDSKEIELVAVNNQVTELSSAVESITYELEEFYVEACNGTWSREEGCVLDVQTLLSPLGGEQFCYGETVNVEWNQSLISGDTVDILLTTPQTTLRLDTVPTAEGVYDWNLEEKHIITTGNGGSANIKEGDIYKIRLQSGGGEIPNSESGVFSIKTLCE